MRKKLKLQDCDLVCVVTVPSADVGSDIYSRHLHTVRTLDGLLRILMLEHVNFKVGYFDPFDTDLIGLHQDYSSFVYGLVFDKDFLDSHPCYITK